MPGVHDRKIEKIRKARDLAADDPELVAAYDAKIAKELAGKDLVNDPDQMRRSVQEVLAIVGELDDRLSDNRRFVCGDDFTLADVVWAVSLFRLKWLGMAFAWTGEHVLESAKRPFVASYGSRLFERPAFRAAVIEWPGVPRTEFVSEHYQT